MQVYSGFHSVIGGGFTVGTTTNPGVCNLLVEGAVNSMAGITRNFNSAGITRWRTENDLGGECSIGLYGSTRTAYGIINPNEAWIYSTRILSVLSDGGYIKFGNLFSSERMRLGAGLAIGGTTDPGAGNLSLGAVPSTALGSTINGLIMGNSSLVAPKAIGASSFFHLANNVIFDGSVWKAISTGKGSSYYQFEGNHTWVTNASVTAGATVTQVDKMRLYESGGLALGIMTDPGAGSFYFDGRILSYYSTTNSKMALGSMEFQPYGINNGWFGENIYFDGSNMKYRATGYSEMVRWLTGQTTLHNFPYGTAGASPAAQNVHQFKCDYNGNVALGGNMTDLTVGVFTGAVIVVRGVGYVDANALRVTGAPSSYPTTGAGIEFIYQTGIAYLQCYDRAASVYKPFNLEASFMRLCAQGGNVGVGASGYSVDPSNTLHVFGPASANPPLRLGAINPNYYWDIGRESLVTGDFIFLTHENVASSEVLRLTVAGKTVFNGPAKLRSYTVGTLPTGAQGDTALVSDANAPTFGATVAGGGAVKIPVYHDGTNWKVG